jgi:hypothetical protein
LTPVKVAVANSDEIDRRALEQLSHVHRREAVGPGG